MAGQPHAAGHPAGGYEQRSNEMPANHVAAGVAFAERVIPREREGRASAEGRIVFLAVGLPVAGVQFEAFRDLASQDRLVNRGSLVILNGAIAGENAEEW